jgi:hypothetical protein
MQSPIDSVRRGLAKFTDQIIERDIDARYMIVLFGLYPEIILDWVDDGYLCRDALAQVRAAEINVFQGPQVGADLTEFNGNVPTWLAHDNHDCVNCNTREATFETINMVLGTAKNNLIVRRSDSRSANLAGPIKFRPNAQKFLIHVTNEDSDCGWYAENGYVDVTKTGGRDGAGRQCGKGQSEGVVENGNAFSPPSPFPLTNTGSVNDLWITEIKDVVDTLIRQNVSIYMFHKPLSGQSRPQFGDPTLTKENADLSGYDPVATLRNYDASNYKDSFQGRMLRANINATARTFDIDKIADSMFVDAFFREIINEVTPDCFSKKRQVTQPQCFTYRCKCDRGCVATPNCLPECQQCKFKLQAADAEETCLAENAPNPSNTCQSCNPIVTKTAWTMCNDANACTADSCSAGKCSFNPICTAQCGFCNINSTCIPKGTSKDLVNCEVCEPLMAFTSWTRTSACTAAPTPAPTPPVTPKPTPAPTPAPTPDTREQCHTYGSCTACRAPNSATHRPCKWCYLAGSHLDTDGTCGDEQSSCFSAMAIAATATSGQCPQEAPTSMPTPAPTPVPTTPMPTPSTTTAEPTTTVTTMVDGAIEGMCSDDMQLGDKRELDDSFGTSKKHCVCGPGRALICTRDPNDCALDVTKEKCEARASQCCYRETPLGALCLSKSNTLCSATTTTSPSTSSGSNNGQARVTNEFGEEVIAAASQTTTATTWAALIVAMVVTI